TSTTPACRSTSATSRATAPWRRPAAAGRLTRLTRPGKEEHQRARKERWPTSTGPVSHTNPAGHGDEPRPAHQQGRDEMPIRRKRKAMTGAAGATDTATRCLAVTLDKAVRCLAVTIRKAA